MKESNATAQDTKLHEERAPEEEGRERLIEEIADDARREPEKWLSDAEVPKGGE